MSSAWGPLTLHPNSVTVDKSLSPPECWDPPPVRQCEQTTATHRVEVKGEETARLCSCKQAALTLAQHLPSIFHLTCSGDMEGAPALRVQGEDKGQAFTRGSWPVLRGQGPNSDPSSPAEVPEGNGFGGTKTPGIQWSTDTFKATAGRHEDCTRPTTGLQSRGPPPPHMPHCAAHKGHGALARPPAPCSGDTQCPTGPGFLGSCDS